MLLDHEDAAGEENAATWPNEGRKNAQDVESPLILKELFPRSAFKRNPLWITSDDALSLTRNVGQFP